MPLTIRVFIILLASLSCARPVFAATWREGYHVSTLFKDADMASIQAENFSRWLDHLDAAYVAYEDLVGAVPYHGNKIKIESVPQYPGGWAVAGNPIKWCGEYVKSELENIDRTDDWSFGILHEIGHDFDLDGRWVWDGEFWANLKMYYVIETLNGIVFQRGVRYQGRNLKEYYLLRYNEEKKNGRIVNDSITYRYIVISEKIGWDAFKNAFRYFLNLPANEIPATPYAKFSLFIDKLSEFSGTNVWSMFLPEEINQLNKNLAVGGRS